MSSSFFRIFIRFAIIFTIITFAIQPYNWFCNITNKCSSITISSLLPTFEGKQEIEVFFEVTSYREDLKITANQSTITTVSGRKNTVTYRAKNLTNRPIRFRANFLTDPDYAEKHIKRYECLCFREYKLKPNEEIELKMVFALNDKIIEEIADSKESKNNNKSKKNSLMIRYKIK